MNTWIYTVEHKSLSDLNDDNLNEMGAMGWELISLKVLVNEASYWAIYKKPKVED